MDFQCLDNGLPMYYQWAVNTLTKVCQRISKTLATFWQRIKIYGHIRVDNILTIDWVEIASKLLATFAITETEIC